MGDDSVRGLAAEWERYCDLLSRLGARIAEGAGEHSERTLSDGFRHLAEQAVCWLTWSVGYSDARHPYFQRQNDLFTQWGGPNVDNIYRHTRIDPSLRYRITGRMHSCQEFIMAVRAGFMHMEKWGTLQEFTASKLGIGSGDDFELLLGGDGSDPAFTPLEPGAIMLSVREYYFTWSTDEPATFTIECLDAAEPLPDADPARVAEDIREAAYILDRSITYWEDYLVEHRGARPLNSFEPPKRISKGLGVARYADCFYSIGPADALVVESEVPRSRYWSMQMATLRWYHSYDVANRITSLNHRQMEVDPDGRFRAVLAHADTGAPNWLDLEGRTDGLMTYRWFWPEADDPQYSAEVVSLDKVWDLMPAGTRRVGPEERAAQIAARRRHAAWRYRT